MIDVILNDKLIYYFGWFWFWLLLYFLIQHTHREKIRKKGSIRGFIGNVLYTFLLHIGCDVYGFAWRAK